MNFKKLFNHIKNDFELELMKFFAIIVIFTYNNDFIRSEYD